MRSLQRGSQTPVRTAKSRQIKRATRNLFLVLLACGSNLPANAQLTPEEIRAASAAGLTTRDMQGTREYHVVPVDMSAAATPPPALTQAQITAQNEARYERIRLESDLSQREQLLPGARAAEQTAVQNLVNYYEGRDGIGARVDYVLDIVGSDTDEEAALKRAVTSSQTRVNGLRTQIRDTRTALETARATNPEINANIQELTGQRAAALQENGSQLNQLITDLNQQQRDLAAAKEAKKAAEGTTNLINEQQYWFEDLADLAVSLTGGENASTRANTALEDATVRERTLTAQVAATRRAITSQQAATTEQDKLYEIAIIKASPRLLAEDAARRSNDAIDNLREVETQRAQIIAGESQFANQTLALGLALTNTVASGGTAAEVAKAEADLRKANEAHQAWRTNMDSELAGHLKSQEQMFEQNRQDGIGETNAGETHSTIRSLITRVNESGQLTEVQKGLMIQDLSAVDQGAVTSTGQSALVIANSAPNMVEFENTWGTFWKDYSDSVVGLSWNDFSLRMGSYTKGVTRAGIDAVKDLVMIVREAGDTQGEAFEAMLEKSFGIRSDVFGSENLATLERIRSGFAKIMDPNDPEGARLAAELVALGEKVANMAKRRVESTAGSGNVRKALEDTGYVVGTVFGVEEVAFSIAARAPKAVRGIALWADAGKALPPSGATPVAGATTDAARAATGGTPPARDVTPAGTNMPATTNAGGNIPTDGTPWGTHLDVEVVKHNPLDDTITLRRSDGTELTLEKKLGSGSTTDVYEVPGRPDIVVRITKPDPTGAALDNAGYRALRKMDPDGTAFTVPERFSQHGVKGADGAPNGIVEVVQRAPTDWRKAQKAGEVLTDGKKAAYQKGMAKINENGFVMLDNKADNYAFVKVGEPDEWKMVIVDAGSVVPVKGLDPDVAARFQRAIDTPIDEATAAGRKWEATERGEVSGRQIHTEWLAENFDHLVDWDAINKLHTDFDFHTLGKGFSGLDLRLNKRFPMNPMNGIENPGIAGPLRPRTPDAPPAPPTDIVGPNRTPTLRERANAANDASGPYTGTKRNPVRTGGDDDGGDGGSGSGGSFISIGGFSGTPVVDPIHFELGPGDLTTSIWTYCPPCSHLTEEYNKLAASGDANPRTKAQMELLLTELSVCEDFYCYEDIDDDGYWQLLQVISQVGNNAYDARDPSNESSSSLGTAQIRVLDIGFLQFIPVLQFNGTSSRHVPFCDEAHYHDSDASELPVFDCEGNSVSDPDSGFCGYGTVSEVFEIPLNICPFFN